MQLAGVVAERGSEQALVARARAGDRDAFARLVEARAERVLRTARAILGNETEAHDAAQDALVSAWVNLPRLRDLDRFDAWILRILRNECHLALRRRRWSRVVDLTQAELAGRPEVRSGTDPAAQRLDAAAVQSAFRRLTVDERTILLLHHLHGLSLEEVSRQLRIPIGTAKSRLFAARGALSRALEAER